MARYRGPRVKKMRALGLKLPGLSAKSIENRPYPPGEHGQARRRKLSDYALQLREKQKLKLNYGLREKQLRGLLKESKNQRQLPTGDKLIESCLSDEPTMWCSALVLQRRFHRPAS